ncbi:hypothetical protein G6N74_03030 [Mesorhizobium sp. CGMCC 1.15528]|uniref:Uncharacterized protein n=1 Tax=Mesorhizobium zhangyense TaxID=1776730 RepID=A0A7C9V9R0_9HYPH|nr:hypothetical protein [Mesorhizobium zhangyense]NGN40030.1 hypothetical protein [Mesorhizobium zhangyense]
MNSAPITAWEGAEAYFTFADKPALLAIFCLAAIAACVYTIVSMVKHENASSRKLNGK